MTLDERRDDWPTARPIQDLTSSPPHSGLINCGAEQEQYGSHGQAISVELKVCRHLADTGKSHHTKEFIQRAILFVQPDLDPGVSTRRGSVEVLDAHD